MHNIVIFQYGFVFSYNFVVQIGLILTMLNIYIWQDLVTLAVPIITVLYRANSYDIGTIVVERDYW